MIDLLTRDRTLKLTSGDEEGTLTVFDPTDPVGRRWLTAREEAFVAVVDYV